MIVEIKSKRTKETIKIITGSVSVASWLAGARADSYTENYFYCVYILIGKTLTEMRVSSEYAQQKLFNECYFSLKLKTMIYDNENIIVYGDLLEFCQTEINRLVGYSERLNDV